MSTPKRILIIAGEASSDMHAANLVNGIKAIDAGVSFWGLGGDRMKAAGVELLEHIVGLAFIGPGGLFKNYLKLRKIYKGLCARIDDQPPDAAILIDYAEFNLRVARRLHLHNVPVIYYISPQVWAWGLWRIKTIKRLVDKMLVFFRFEEKLYKSYGIDVSFVGHPLIGNVKPGMERDRIIKAFGLGKDKKIIGIVPGSRKNEIDTMLPIMLDSAKIISDELGAENLEFVMPLAATIDESHVRGLVKEKGADIKIVRDNTYNAISVCDCAMVTSGTATLETALLGVPMAIIYKSGFLTYILVKNIINLPFIGLVNIVAGRSIVPEFLQYEARPADIAKYITGLIRDKKLSSSVKEELSRIKDSLGEPGASGRAAREVVSFLNAKAKETMA